MPLCLQQGHSKNKNALVVIFKKDQPYNDLPELPLKTDVETKAILKGAIKANRALAKLVGSGKQLPNQNMLINAISLQEAKLRISLPLMTNYTRPFLLIGLYQMPVQKRCFITKRRYGTDTSL